MFVAFLPHPEVCSGGIDDVVEWVDLLCRDVCRPAQLRNCLQWQSFLAQYFLEASQFPLAQVKSLGVADAGGGTIWTPATRVQSDGGLSTISAKVILVTEDYIWVFGFRT